MTGIRFLVALSFASLVGIVFADDAPPDFEKEIQPLLVERCAHCHGNDTQKAELNLETAAGILKGGESGPILVAGDPDKSAVYEKVHSGEMPPEGEPRLSEKEVELIHRWIAAGAKTGSAEVKANQPPSQHDVIPIMLRRCTVCHGRERREAELDLRTKESMLKGGKSGPAIVLEKPDESLLIKKIHDGSMPPRAQLVEVSIKPIEENETAIVARWIAAGAPEVEIAADVATTTPDLQVSDDDRNFWSFRAPRRPELPQVRDSHKIRNAIDTFVLQKLEAKGKTFAPEADKLTLLRRLHFDLTGLPPEPAEIDAFLADTDPQAYEHLVDRLLASPRYGERWGRYWLDLAGYADSEGKREQDLPRPYVWRYRDYVIQSLNNDKPYDRFLLEQLAGDELADYENAKEITPEIYDNLVATAFLKLAPDATWANITGYVPDRLEVIADEIDILSSSVLGLTLKCARCHGHKFDPIPQRDYYRLAAVFQGALDEYDWLKPDIRPGIGPVSQDTLPGRHLPYVTTSERNAWLAHEAEVTKQINESKEKGEPQDKIAALERQRKPEPRIQALWDRGYPSPTYIYRRGDALQPARLVGPGVPSVLTDGKTPLEVVPPWPGAKQTGRRLAFAKWTTQPDHPLTARVQVNRMWQHHFGRGIVETLGNFGKTGSRPTHPDLLDWLATQLVEEGWRLKPIHRLMVTSATYRQTSALASEDDRTSARELFSPMPLTRVDAEALYDSLLLVAGRLDETRYGPADGVDKRPDGLVTPVGTARGWRRLIYVQQLRKQMATHREYFDFPQMNPNCLERRDSMVAPQALYLMNNTMVLNLAEQFASRVEREAGADLGQQVERVYKMALNRLPTDEEKQLGLAAIGELTTEAAKTAADTAAHQALAAYCHAVINSASFLFID